MNEEKRMIGSYEVEHSIHLGDKEVVLGVDKKEQYPFMVCYCTYDNPLGVPWATEAVGSDDYLEAMQIFLDRVQAQVELSRAELAKYPFDKTVFTVKDCIPDDKGKSIFTDLSFALGNKLLGVLDEKQHRERLDKSKGVGWYKKTDFEISAVIGGEDFHYEGRFDIGDGEGDLIAHIKNFYDYCLSPNCPFIPEWKRQGEDYYREQMETLRFGA